MRSQVSTVDTSQKGGTVEPAVVKGRDGKFYPRRAAGHDKSHDETNAFAAPDPIEAALQSALAFDACLTRLNDVSRAAVKLASGPGGGYFDRQLPLYQDHLKRALELLGGAKPHARCRQCGGAGCEVCLELGYTCATSFD
jgi:hypothetical protein